MLQKGSEVQQTKLEQPKPLCKKGVKNSQSLQMTTEDNFPFQLGDRTN